MKEILPGLFNFTTDEYYNLTEQEAFNLGILLYVMIAQYMVLLWLTVVNIKNFLLREERYKVQPILMFYIFVVLLCVSRIAFQIWFYAIDGLRNYMGMYFPISMKMSIGAMQGWILIEITLKINHGIRVFLREEKHGSSRRIGLSVSEVRT